MITVNISRCNDTGIIFPHGTELINLNEPSAMFIWRMVSNFAWPNNNTTQVWLKIGNPRARHALAVYGMRIRLRELLRTPLPLDIVRLIAMLLHQLDVRPSDEIRYGYYLMKSNRMSMLMVGAYDGCEVLVETQDHIGRFPFQDYRPPSKRDSLQWS